MRPRYLFATAFLLFSFWNLVSPFECRADVYQGTVLDEETGSPLADAVLVVVWWTKAYIGFEHPRYFHEAREALTDANGRFSLGASPAINWNPLIYVESPPTIIIYKPGYRPLMGATAVMMGFRRIGDVEVALKRGTVVKLSKLKAHEEILTYTGVLSLTGANVPMESVPNLTRLVNIQRKMAGITSLFPESKKGEKLQ